MLALNQNVSIGLRLFRFVGGSAVVVGIAAIAYDAMRPTNAELAIGCAGAGGAWEPRSRICSFRDCTHRVGEFKVEPPWACAVRLSLWGQPEVQAQNDAGRTP